MDDLEEVEKKAITASQQSAGNSSSDEHHDRKVEDDRKEEDAVAEVKIEMPSQVNDRREAVSEDGWIKKPVKSRGRTNGSINGMMNGGGAAMPSMQMVVQEMNLVAQGRTRIVWTPTVNGNAREGEEPRKNFKRFKRSARRDFQDISRLVVMRSVLGSESLLSSLSNRNVL